MGKIFNGDLIWFFLIVNSLTFSRHKPWKGLKNATSHGYNMWVELRGKQIKIMSCSVQISEIAILTWLWWPVRYNTTGNLTWFRFSSDTNWWSSQKQNASTAFFGWEVYKSRKNLIFGHPSLNPLIRINNEWWQNQTRSGNCGQNRDPRTWFGFMYEIHVFTFLSFHYLLFTGVQQDEGLVTIKRSFWIPWNIQQIFVP